MSCSITVDAVRARTKTVTRRHASTWATLKPGDRLTLIERGMGLKRGEKQVVLAEVEVVDNRVEPLTWITDDDVVREGFVDMDADEFVAMWVDAHGVKFTEWDGLLRYEVRRIEWRYVS